MSLLKIPAEPVFREMSIKGDAQKYADLHGRAPTSKSSLENWWPILDLRDRLNVVRSVVVPKWTNKVKYEAVEMAIECAEKDLAFWDHDLMRALVKKTRACWKHPLEEDHTVITKMRDEVWQHARDTHPQGWSMEAPKEVHDKMRAADVIEAAASAVWCSFDYRLDHATWHYIATALYSAKWNAGFDMEGVMRKLDRFVGFGSG